LWAPQVFDLAKDHGLILLEDGSLLDQQAGEVLAKGQTPMPRTTSEQVACHELVDSEGAEKIVIRESDFNWSSGTALSGLSGVQEVALLGPASKAEALPAGHLGWPHGFSLRALSLSPGASIPEHRRREEEVIFMQKGSCRINVDGESLDLNPGDTFTIPLNASRSFTNESVEDCVVYLTRRGDQPEAPDFI
jgi:mannose-6-phosphate isomerase-like protein (cupin superfamily)